MKRGLVRSGKREQSTRRILQLSFESNIRAHLQKILLLDSTPLEQRKEVFRLTAILLICIMRALLMIMLRSSLTLFLIIGTM